MKFKKEKKEDLLQGRTIRYLLSNSNGKNGLECTEIHLYNVLNGKSTCSKYLAKDIVSIARPDKKVEDYFDKK